MLYNKPMPPLHELLGLGYLYEALQKERATEKPSSTFFQLQEKYSLAPSVTESLRESKKVFSRLLKAFPEDPYYRWMNQLLDAWLGQGFTPGSLNERNLSSLSLRFRESGDELGIGHAGMVGGIGVEDFDQDGTYDIISGSMGLNDPLFYYKGNPAGGFHLKNKEALLEGSTGGLSIITGDFNNDGFPDVYVARGGTMASAGKLPNSLLRNNKDGTFTDITVQAGLLNNYPSNHAHFVDYNNDGNLDLFVANESVTSHFANANPCQLFHNNGNGTFTDVSVKTGLYLSEMVKGSAWLDANNDGWMDVYVSIAGDSNQLYLNKGPGSKSGGQGVFEKVAGAGGAAGPFNSGYCVASDINQDGWEDLLVFQTKPNTNEASYASPFVNDTAVSLVPFLFLNQGNGTFQKAQNSWAPTYSVLALGGASGDLSNNGYPDVYVGTGNANLQTLVPNSLLVNEGNSLAVAGPASGTALLGKTHAVRLADLNHDGNLDIVASTGGFFEVERMPPALMINESPIDYAWVKIKLKGKKANRQGVGSRIQVTTINQEGNEQNWYHRVGTGHSPAEVHIGLGKAKEIKEVTIQWADPSGKLQKVQNLPVNQRLTIQQE